MVYVILALTCVNVLLRLPLRILFLSLTPSLLPRLRNLLRQRTLRGPPKPVLHYRPSPVAGSLAVLEYEPEVTELPQSLLDSATAVGNPLLNPGDTQPEPIPHRPACPRRDHVQHRRLAARQAIELGSVGSPRNSEFVTSIKQGLGPVAPHQLRCTYLFGPTLRYTPIGRRDG